MEYSYYDGNLIVIAEHPDEIFKFENWFNTNHDFGYRSLRWDQEFKKAIKYFETKVPSKVIEDYSAVFIDNVFGFLLQHFTLADIVLFDRAKRSFNENEKVFLRIKFIKFESKIISRFEDTDFWRYVNEPISNQLAAFEKFCSLFEQVVERRLVFDDSNFVISKLQV